MVPAMALPTMLVNAAATRAARRVTTFMLILERQRPGTVAIRVGIRLTLARFPGMLRGLSETGGCQGELSHRWSAGGTPPRF